MSYYVWCEIVCRGCASTVAGVTTSNAIPRRDMTNEAKKDGWVRKSKEWYCRHCSKKGVSK